MPSLDDPSSEPLQVGDFTGIETTGRAKDYVEWMARQRRAGPDRAIDALGLQPGDTALDIGCGPGADLAGLTGRCRTVVGLDLSPTMLEAARESSGVRAMVAGDGGGLPFTAGAFAGCWARAVLIHAQDASAVVTEIGRVLRSGGRAVLSEPDHGSHIVATDLGDVFERIKIHRRSKFQNPLVGRALGQLATDAGLELIDAWATPIVHRSFAVARAAGGPFDRATADAVTDGAISAFEGEQYLSSLEELDRQGAFLFVALSVSVVVAA